MAYRHTQTSPGRFLGPALILAAFVITATITQQGVVLLPAAAFALLIMVILVTSSRLTTTVNSGNVRVAFGWGFPRRTIALADIADAEPIRNRWYHGWGIRLIPKGWMFNVWGLDAVELELASGRRFRIGTDEPQELAAAIQQALSRR